VTAAARRGPRLVVVVDLSPSPKLGHLLVAGSLGIKVHYMWLGRRLWGLLGAVAHLTNE
jgi:hypothetical protein